MFIVVTDDTQKPFDSSIFSPWHIDCVFILFFMELRTVKHNINMTKAAVHFGVVVPFIGDASLEGAARDFTEEAKKEGAKRVRIVQSNETTLWWILPPPLALS